MMKAIIFDFDGLLADTEPYHYRAYKKSLSDFGFNISKEKYLQHYFKEGKSSKDLVNGININVPFELIKKKKYKYYEGFIKEKIELMPGALNLLKKFFNKYVLAIA